MAKLRPEQVALSDTEYSEADAESSEAQLQSGSADDSPTSRASPASSAESTCLHSRVLHMVQAPTLRCLPTQGHAASCMNASGVCPFRWCTVHNSILTLQ
jgi:hypothetical protein